MGRVIWSPAALHDVELIAQYIARDSTDHAALFITRLIDTANDLKNFPHRGRMIPELNASEKRELFVGTYRLMYKIDGNDVWITAIVHGARDWGPDDSNE